MLEVCNLDHSVAMSNLKKGLKGNSFYFFLSRRFSCNFFELLTYVDKYINAKKSMVEKRKEKMKQQRARKDNPAPHLKKQKGDRKPSHCSQCPRHFESFTPLKTS